LDRSVDMSTAMRLVRLPQPPQLFRCCRLHHRRLSSSAAACSPLPALRAEKAEEISQLAEVLQRERFQQQLEAGACQLPAGAAQGLGGMSADEAELALDAGFLTFLTHVESRISSAVGQGFYTIGPCGEELMAAMGCVLRPTDAMALHYRHLATQIARQLRSGKSVEQVLLDRARGHVVSASDPVTAGVHCSIGGGPTDYIVSSTLASQCPPAIGRALGNQLAHGLPGIDKAGLPLPKDAVSLVSVGDGSVNNGHFLSAVNLAGYARHRGYKCPTVFVVTNNEVCISLRGHGWIEPFLSNLHMPLHKADGMDMVDIYDASTAAIEHARQRQSSVCLLVDNVPRRFGHAATDRQAAYLSAEEISLAEQTNPLEGAAAQLVSAAAGSFSELATKFARFSALAEEAFDVAAAEAKITDVNHMVKMNSAPLAVPASPPAAAPAAAAAAAPTAKERRPAVMRKHMTSVISESLECYPEAVYLGEDVEHGGYYLVTDGLSKRYPNRVRDFPPDETSLIGTCATLSRQLPSTAGRQCLCQPLSC
jgi:TPP-dependent pyruvate/acetoin dehydrogenase alpha subunit